MKRSLIPIIGKGLAYLSGTATEADWSVFKCIVSLVASEGISSLTICTITFTVQFYYTGNKKNNLASKFSCGACTVTIKHDLTLFTISHYPKKFEGFAIRNRESYTRVFKVTV